ncbi:MAG: HelD family protein [Acidimicrobiales bacterium]
MEPHPDLKAEQAYLDRAYERLADMRASAEKMMGSVMDGGRGGTHQAREEREVIVQAGLRRLAKLNIGRQALVFGRTDSPDDVYYIGRLAVADEDLEPLVLDWRAPVAEPFYRATGRHPMGLLRRRHFASEDQRLVGIEDEVFSLRSPEGGSVLAEDDQTVGPGALLAALERSRSGHMRDIVATVQAEQDEVIRAPLPGVLVVQGGPGTGKTAVALHRAAYLLYTHRFPLENQGVLVLGPNQVFLRYIAQVLPSLGETGVALSTVEGLVSGVRIKAAENPRLTALKGEARMAKVLAKALADRQRGLARDLEVPFGAHVLRLGRHITAAVVERAKSRGGPHNARHRYVKGLLVRQLHRVYERSAALYFSDNERAELSIEEFGHALGRGAELIEALNRMWPRLHPEELLHDLFGAPALIALAGQEWLDDHEIQALFRPRSSALDDIEWTRADLALLDEARCLLGPVHPGDEAHGPPAYGHILVDEAQDLSPMELRMVGRRSISGSITLVGDLAQATSARAPTTWDQVVAELDVNREGRLVELTVNYRTPAQVMALAGRVLAAADPRLRMPRSVRTTGDQPFFEQVEPDRLIAAVVEAAGSAAAGVGYGTVGVIVPASLAEVVLVALEEAGIRVADAARDGLDAPVTVVTPDLVKGLEFDHVIVVEPGLVADEAVQALRTLYVAFTRATRKLSVVHTGLLPAALAPVLATDKTSF